MSYADEQEFWDVTPHRIEVTSLGKLDNYGRQELDPTTKRTYRCMVSSGFSTSKTAQGVTTAQPVNAWVLATPVDRSGPIRILDTDEVHFVNVPGQEDRPLAGVTSYYADDGSLHNMLARFT